MNILGKIIKMFLVIISIVIILAYRNAREEGFRWHEVPEMSMQEFDYLWHPFKANLSDGKVLAMDLPMEVVENHESTSWTPFVELTSYESKGEHSEGYIKMMHGVLKENQTLTFDQQFFGKLYLSRARNLQVNDTGIRRAGGMKFNVIQGETNQSKEAFMGAQNGKDVWCICIAWSKEAKDEAFVIDAFEKSLDSMKIQ